MNYLKQREKIQKFIRFVEFSTYSQCACSYNITVTIINSFKRASRRQRTRGDDTVWHRCMGKVKATVANNYEYCISRYYYYILFNTRTRTVRTAITITTTTIFLYVLIKSIQMEIFIYSGRCGSYSDNNNNVRKSQTGRGKRKSDGQLYNNNNNNTSNLATASFLN